MGRITEVLLLATLSSSKVQALSIPEQVEQQLDQKLAAANPATTSHPRQQHFSQISPWLDTNQWARYLQGRDLLQAARLIQLPSPAAQQTASDMQPRSAEHLLILLLEAFDRVIEQARHSLLEDRVNVFDQHRVNSFIPRRKSSGAIKTGHFSKIHRERYPFERCDSVGGFQRLHDARLPPCPLYIHVATNVPSFYYAEIHRQSPQHVPAHTPLSMGCPE